MTKKTLLTLAALALGLLVLAGCSDDNDNPTDLGGGGGIQVETGTITITFDGVELDFSEDSVGTDDDPGWCVFVGHGADAGQTMTVRAPTAVGTYAMGEAGQPSVSFVYDNLAWMTETGSMTITAVSGDNIEGTFSGTFWNLQSETAPVTAGSFDVPITGMP